MMKTSSYRSYITRCSRFTTASSISLYPPRSRATSSLKPKKIVTHHYQWCVVHDFLTRVCGATAVNAAITSVRAPVGSSFNMPAEFAMAAYRFGHSMIRNGYVLNSSLPAAASTLANVFAFIRVPRLPVFSNWTVDFNMFFNTAHPIAGFFNNARTIDSVLANGLEGIPGGSGIMAILAARNLRRGLALGLPSGQGAARSLRIDSTDDRAADERTTARRKSRSSTRIPDCC